MKLSTFVDQEYWPYASAYLKAGTQRVYKNSLTHSILPRFGCKQLHKITRKDIEQWLAPFQKKAPVAANRALATFSAVMNRALWWGYIDFNPCAGVQKAKEKGRERFLTPEEIRTVKAALPSLAPAEAAFVLILMYTGARPGELQALNPDATNVERIVLEDSKTGRRTIYLPEKVQMALLLYHGEFEKINHQTLTRRIRRLTQIKDFRLYDLRHTFASVALAGGCTLEQIGQLLGHRNYQTTKRYAHLMPETGKEAVAKAAAVLD